jgi:putative peptidoglycan lipid II flippase
VPVRVRRVLGALGRPVLAAAVATAAGAYAASRADASAAGLLAGCPTVIVVFALLGRALGDQGVTSALRHVRSATRRLPHVRTR